MCGVHPSYDSSSVSLSFGPGKFDLQASSPVRITKLFKLPKTSLNHEDLKFMKSRFDWNQLDTKLSMWFDKNMWKWKKSMAHLHGWRRLACTSVHQDDNDNEALSVGGFGRSFRHGQSWIFRARSTTHQKLFFNSQKWIPNQTESVMKPRWN